LVLGIHSGGVFAEIPVSCRDSGKCPDLTSAVTEQRIVREKFGPNSCAVLEHEVEGSGKRKLLRFTFTSPNIGEGDIIIGNPTASENDGLFEFNTCHGHAHFIDFADYRLWTMKGYKAWNRLRQNNPEALASDVLADNPGPEEELVKGAKRGYCMLDIYYYDTSLGGVGKYDNCAENQGISVGWADVYGYKLDGQWIDITELPPGSYMLEVEVNAERLFMESNYSNNRKAAPVRIR
jgi:hypothetical protein